ncbi:MAG: DUF3300 domain-containing protein [Bradyrhizobium sp.]|nr:DUF3300 domain-containing protein [Bradyrhizobium sp.]
MRPLKTIGFLVILILGTLHFAQPALAQTSDQNAAPPPAAATPPPAPATSAPAPAAAPAPATPAPELLKPAELDGLVAPIALYPDTLLANVLMAATYPLEVVRADRWLKDNSKLKEDALKAAAEQQNWDSSVKALVAAPSVLQMLSERLDWTQKLGEAFLAQQQDVMDAVQRLRSRAYDRKKLSTTPQQVVTVRQEQDRPMIYIEPAVPDMLYVPYYDPPVMFGDWPYADYPPYPYYWGYPGFIAAGVIATGLAFGAGYALGRWSRGGYWGAGGFWGGSRVNWSGGGININRGGRVEHWQHNPAHRQGARYNNAGLQQKFGNPALRQGGRQGIGQGQNLRQGANRPNVADRAQRAGAGRAAGNRQAVSRNRPSAGRSARANRVASRPAGGRHGGAGRFAGGGNRAAFRGGGGGFRGGGRASFHGGGGGFRGGGGRGGGGRGGGRRSDIALKHDIVLLGHLDSGLGYYRFAYNGSNKAYVGVMAQEVSVVRPDAVERGSDGYLRVHYDRLGLKFRSYDDWVASGGRVPNSR